MVRTLDVFYFFFFSSRRRHTRCGRDWSSDVCSSDLRSAFLDAFRSLGESAVQFVTRITNSLELYLDSRGINKDYNRLLELMVSDRFRDTLDEETRHYVADHEHDG